MKICTVCKEEKPLEDYHKRASSKDGRQSRCKPCAISQNIYRYAEETERLKEYQRAYDRANVAKIRKRRIMREYSVTEEEADALTQVTNCEICGSSGPLHVDHCHTSNEVRGVLCLNCNTALGGFKDNPILLEKAIKYLMPL